MNKLHTTALDAYIKLYLVCQNQHFVMSQGALRAVSALH